MSSISPRNYQIGVCFTCQLCMYCGLDLTSNNCNCDKSIKPTKKNRTKEVANFRNLTYKPAIVHEKIKNTLSNSNQKYGYKLDIELPYNCTLCSACNSQINRNVKAADKEKKNIIVIPSSPTDGTSLPSTPLQMEFKLRMSIKQNKQVLPFVIISFTLDNPNFINFRDKLESYICEQVGLVYRNEYTLAYKSHSESGAGTLLGNEEAFDEFLKDYQSIVAGNKKVVIIVILRELSKKRSHENEVSEQESNDESENEAYQNTKSKKQLKKHIKKRIPKEATLNENEALVGSYVMKLNDKYICEIQNHKRCFIKEDRHLSLTNFAISLWAKEIVNKNADLDTPPNHAIFSMMHSVKVTRKDSSNIDNYPQSMTAYPQYSQQMYFLSPFSYNYPDCDYNIQSRTSISQISDHSTSVNSQISDHSSIKKIVPNMEDFLQNLDQEFGDGKFTCYLSIFEEQEILVNQLARLSDSEYILMDVTIIGRRQILRDEAKKYE
ncbi:uncharacterized protein OCT59_023864 [Rhizophagus irregularis]|uniref:uncharacterized protein n=1 Tax=Rhizophagus irregularis TaxID=588596 RepID=UPI000CB0E983|nr:hypothetical protein OCT59_023864 [Rhizophagus irregularis]GBC21930.1 hypothetical protein GLOIN_2v444467 [Rhizophagus irregularis DAOM 181602=DAOM 197198]CAG8562730.1 9706_t:CDS:2 [Rhizophagus irregularis]